MNLHNTKCPVCGGAMTPVFSRKTQTYLNYKKCWNDIDPFDREQYDLEPHEFFKDTPAIFRDTVIDKIPNENIKAALVDILQKPGDRGTSNSFIIHGTTGSAKTRAAWVMANHWFYSRYPSNPLFISPRKLDAWLIGSFSDSIKEHEKCVTKMCESPLLIIDDLGKERITPRVESDLFAIIDERVCNRKDTYITTNYNATMLIERFPTKETAVALVRRLREHFISIGTGKEGVSK